MSIFLLFFAKKECVQSDKTEIKSNKNRILTLPKNFYFLKKVVKKQEKTLKNEGFSSFLT